MVTIVWDTRVRKDVAPEGLKLVERIWTDMKAFAGYRSHRLLRDRDEAGHFIIVSEWTDRASADQSLRDYRDAEPVRMLTPLLAEPRKRFVMDE